MKEIILNKLKEIEDKENVKVLYAIESGSRAWGFESESSDYDVRFIYVRDKKEYLKLNPNRDVIEFMLNDELDINGWDLDKTLKLLHKTNPTLFEWFHSPIVYKTTSYFNNLKKISHQYFSAKSSLHHYLNMAEGNYRTYLKNDLVPFKKYFYVLRPILACLWIIDEQSAPPVLFKELVDSKLDKNLFGLVEGLIEKKKNSLEKALINKIDVLNEYIEISMNEIKQKINTFNQIEFSYDELNEFFLEGLDYYTKGK